MYLYNGRRRTLFVSLYSRFTAHLYYSNAFRGVVIAGRVCLFVILLWMFLADDIFFTSPNETFFTRDVALDIRFSRQRAYAYNIYIYTCMIRTRPGVSCSSSGGFVLLWRLRNYNLTGKITFNKRLWVMLSKDALVYSLLTNRCTENTRNTI